MTGVESGQLPVLQREQYRGVSAPGTAVAEDGTPVAAGGAVTAGGGGGTAGGGGAPIFGDMPFAPPQAPQNHPPGPLPPKQQMLSGAAPQGDTPQQPFVPPVTPPPGTNSSAGATPATTPPLQSGGGAPSAAASSGASGAPVAASPAIPGKLVHTAGTGRPPRLEVYECETSMQHMHHLRPARRHEKLTKMLKDLFRRHEEEEEQQEASSSSASKLSVGGAHSGLHSGAHSGGSDSAGPVRPSNSILADQESADAVWIAAQTTEPPSLLVTLATQMRRNERSADEVLSSVLKQRNTMNDSLLHERYGQLSSVIGKGSFGVVRLAQKADPMDKRRKLVYAVKEFHLNDKESEAAFMKRLASEFCLASSLHHLNIIETLDLLRAGSNKFCGVMEYCAGGDLYSLIAVAGKLETVEADCFFKQVMRGVTYMHEMGVAHRDLKPENVLLTSRGCVKLTDFGNAECFRMAWEEEVHLSSHLAGSGPYIAPEEYVKSEFDPRPVDVWAAGVIYLAMCTGRHLWLRAEPSDDFYANYLRGRKDKDGYEPIERLKTSRRRNVIYSMLDPVASRRLKAKQVLNSEWGREIVVCEAGSDHTAKRTK